MNLKSREVVTTEYVIYNLIMRRFDSPLSERSYVVAAATSEETLKKLLESNNYHPEHSPFSYIDPDTQNVELYQVLTSEDSVTKDCGIKETWGERRMIETLMRKFFPRPMLDSDFPFYFSFPHPSKDTFAGRWVGELPNFDGEGEDHQSDE